jgi:hypothetical protein
VSRERGRRTGARVLLDGAAFDVARAATWGQALVRLDDAVGRRGLIVTDVRFDGVDEPAFRGAHTLDRRLADLACVEVESGTPASLMERCMSEALTAIDVLSHAAVQVADQFRGPAIVPARQQLAELAEGLGTLMAITGAAGLALKVDAQRAVHGDRSIASVITEMTGHLDALIEAQEARDWGRIADVLERDVQTALQRWKPVIEVFAQPA